MGVRLDIKDPARVRPARAIAPASIAQAAIARAVCRKYGLASGHPARLSLSDRFDPALAKVTGEPLLSKSGDFAHTHIAPAA